MTQKDILNQLGKLDEDVLRLLRDTGFTCDGFVLRDGPVPSDPDDAFMWEKLTEVLDQLESFHEGLSRLTTKNHGERKLTRLGNGRYGYLDHNAQNVEFTCGQSIEALIREEGYGPRWVNTRVEHDSVDYYLVGYPQVPLQGLTIRERW